MAKNRQPDDGRTTVDEEELPARLQDLSDTLALFRFDLVADPDAGYPALRDRLRADLAGHRARLEHWEAPLLAVLGGGTGAGKSTVANSLAGQVVAATGVIRPTTSVPTLVAHPDDRDWFTGDRILPGFARRSGVGTSEHVRAPGEELGNPVRDDRRELHMAVAEAVPTGLALLDAPDVDSVRTTNRELADALLDAADVWVWFVTARTYADEEGMRYLRRAQHRRTALGVVLTQVHPDDLDEVRTDLRAKLAAEGLGDVAVLTVPHSEVTGQRLDEAAIAELRAWLWPLAQPARRDRMRRQTLQGALADLEREAGPLVAAVEEERTIATELRSGAERAFAAVSDRLAESLDDGIPLRREILERWGEIVGGGRLLALAESATGMVRMWVRDALGTVLGAEEERLQRRVQAAVADTVAVQVVAAVDLAVAETAGAWRHTPGGSMLLARRPELSTAAPDLRPRAEDLVAGWQDEVAELIRTRGAERKVRARWVTTVVNAAATTAILLAFASTGGLTGAEVGITAGAGAAQQALLAKLLGRQNLSWLLREVRTRLLDRVDALAVEESRRHLDAVVAAAPQDADLAALRDAITAVIRESR
jgi:hypothetical protein